MTSLNSQLASERDSTDIKWMSLALDLAKRGQGSVSPNPMVGSVIVGANGELLSSGWHKVYGGPHAEVEAANALAPDADLNGCSWYVTLEPCSHYGKTPPCAELLVRLLGGKTGCRVVVAMQDPNPLVAGRGLELLRKAGIEVTVGVCESEAKELNKAFLHRIQTGLPYITLKWAETSDGFVARLNGDSKWISSALSRMAVHKLRANCNAVAVGGSTVMNDNPQLGVRDWWGPQPKRVAFLGAKPLPLDYQLFSGELPTIIVPVGQGSADFWQAQVKDHGLPVVILHAGLASWDDVAGLEHVLKELVSHGIQRLLVEGGSKTLSLFIQTGFWQEAWVVTNPNVSFGAGIASPLSALVPLASEHEHFMLGGDKWRLYKA